MARRRSKAPAGHSPAYTDVVRIRASCWRRWKETRYEKGKPWTYGLQFRRKICAESARTVHLTRPSLGPDDAFLARTAHELSEKFGIHHSTIQIEHDGAGCRLAPAHVIW